MAVLPVEPTEDQLEAAWSALRKPGWTRTLAETKEAALHWALVRMYAMYASLLARGVTASHPAALAVRELVEDELKRVLPHRRND